MAEHARALTEEFGEAAARYAMGGSNAQSLSNASRQYKGLVRKFNFSLNVKVSFHDYYENGAHVCLPFLKPSHILQCLLDNYPWLLLGGLKPGSDSDRLLLTFWRHYQKFQPSHAVFVGTDDLKLSKTIPLLLHGDAGRTQRKLPLEIVMLEAVLGLDSSSHETCFCRCAEACEFGGPDLSSPYAQRLNQKHSSYLSRFLVFAFNSKQYPLLPGLLRSMLEALSVDLGRVCQSGLAARNTRWHFATIGMKGDLEYHQKIGTLERSYLNVGRTNFIKCCHLCGAGDAQHPFEDVSERASWVNTLNATVPWQPHALPPFSPIPYEDWTGNANGMASSWFRLDPFHVFRLGVARNFIASVLLLLCFKGFYDADDSDSRSLESRLARAWSYFELYCLQAGTRPLGIRSFSRSRLHYEKEGNFPYITGKGSDSILILKFLRFFLELQLRDSQTPANSQMLRHMLQGCEHGLAFSQSIHGHSLWLSTACAVAIKKHLQGFGNSYVRLAALCMHEGKTLFAMVPKIHSLMHFRTDLLAGIQSGGPVLNVCLWDCSQNEDYVGKIARHSRRISNRHVEHGIIRAYLVKSKFVIKRFKAKRGL